MRLIQVFVPRDDREAAQERLTEMEVEFVFSDADGQCDGSLASVPVPTGAVDVMLDGLYDTGLDEDTYTVVTDVDRAKVPNIDEMTERYVEAPKGERGTWWPFDEVLALAPAPVTRAVDATNSGTPPGSC